MFRISVCFVVFVCLVSCFLFSSAKSLGTKCLSVKIFLDSCGEEVYKLHLVCHLL